MKIASLIWFILITIACSRKKELPLLFSQMQETGIHFTNNLQITRDFNVFSYRNFYNGGGVATGDVNNDGLADVFLTANQGPNKLFINKGAFQFEDVSDKAGLGAKEQWSTGVVMADVNADGWLDIYVCNAGHMLDSNRRRNQLFINNKNGKFSDSAAAYGLDNTGYSTQSSFFDYDGDGDLDCALINNSPIPVNTLDYSQLRDMAQKDVKIAEFLKGGGDHLYRNDGGRFIEVTKEAGLHGGLISLGLGITVGDVNGDGWPDMYISNDFYEKDYLYINQRNGSFKDELEQRVQHASLSSMGADLQDVNNDGYPDLFTTDMLPDDDYRLKANSSFENYDVFTLKQRNGFHNQYTQNALQVNNRDGSFSETGFFSGVAASDWSWGALIFDADGDGLSDIYVSNGIYKDVTNQDFIDFFANEVVQQMALTGKKEEMNNVINKMPSVAIPNKIFHNRGGLRFNETGKAWGLDEPSFSNGSAYADFDNDGDLDLVVNNVNSEAFVYRNNSREQDSNHYIALQLQYTTPNLFAVGSIIRLYQGGAVMTREVIPSRGFQSSVEYKQTFGLGKEGVDSVQIIWPNRTVSTIIQPAADTLLRISYASVPTKDGTSANTSTDPFFKPEVAAFAKHAEDAHVDFYYERNIPFMLSKQGPKGAVGDVNGDGLEDVFIGGARGQGGRLYLQTGSGFVEKSSPDFQTYSFNDATAVLLFDCDGDKDLDLMVGGGGNNSPAAPGNYQNLLFVNDGSGNFSLLRGAVPATTTNCSAVVPLDYNRDGRTDVVVTSRSVAQDYGRPPQSFLWKNEGGLFTDVTTTAAPDLLTAGMVTAAAATDADGDGLTDIVLVGDWMAPMVLKGNGSGFKKIDNGLEGAKGWWQSITAADTDKDGDIDLVLGNLGENFYLHPKKDEPVKLWMGDFDNNSTADKIISKTWQGKDVPVFTKRDLTDALPGLKKMNLKHEEYARKTVPEIFGAQIKDALVMEVRNAQSAIAYNNGKGQFTLKPLPLPAQLSSVSAIHVEDLNGDEYPDLVLAGNFFDLLPQFCRLDANSGLVLINDRKGNFAAVEKAQTGLNLQGQTRDILSVNMRGSRHLLFLENNNVPLLYRFNNLPVFNPQRPTRP